MPVPSLILRVAVPSPLRRLFDYLPPSARADGCRPGTRVRVPFGRASQVGVIVEVSGASALPPGRLKRVAEALDDEPLLPASLLELARWASTYYHHPPGEVFHSLLPTALRRGEEARVREDRAWSLTAPGRSVDPASLGRAPRQAQLLRVLGAADRPLAAGELPPDVAWRPVLAALAAKGWVEATRRPCLEAAGAAADAVPDLNEMQSRAAGSIADAGGGYGAFLLDGVTGSGKTEVYLRAIDGVLARGRQALVLVPEIGLTPQIVGRFRRRFRVPVAVLHSGLGEGERLCAWLMARSGEAPIVIGTRSAVFTPLATPGIIVVDEEHDGSFKQQEGFRYSARDLAVVRARLEDVPVVLGSATPSLESLRNANEGRYRYLHLSERAGDAVHPRFRVVDIRGHRLDEGLSPPLLEAIGAHLGSGGQVLLFLNRRGYAPSLICHECGWVAECRRCDARRIYHQREGRLKCHHCGAEQVVPRQCPGCGAADLRAVGLGTERVEDGLKRHFPGTPVARIDRDSTRRRGAMEGFLEGVKAGRSRILVGTQMLAKGHHFPGVTLVAVLDADGGFFSADFRAPERMAQLIMQVAGRAGRAERPGEVLVQTRQPDHPLLLDLTRSGYTRFAEGALAERRLAGWPPYSALALVRAEAGARDRPMAFLAEAAAEARALADPGVGVFGPVAAPMERRAGRWRAQLLLQADTRSALQTLLGPLAEILEGLRSARTVRWSLDVDPVDMF